MTKDIRTLLEKAESIRTGGDGGWNRAIEFLEKEIIPFAQGDEFAQAYKIHGWSLYFRAIKDFGDLEEDKIKVCAEAEESLMIALSATEDSDILISAYNCLPLVLWIQGKQDEAWRISNEVTSEKFSEVSSVWNTLGILCKWSKQHERAVEVFEMVYQTAFAIGDLRTAGHGKQNQGDSLEKLGNKELAKDAYKEAKELYLQFEKKSGQKATIHIDGVTKKIALLLLILCLIISPRMINVGVLSSILETPSFFI